MQQTHTQKKRFMLSFVVPTTLNISLLSWKISVYKSILDYDQPL